MFHYLKIAENIFQKENLNLDKNNSKDNFDLYIGESLFNEKYRLILYKGTKIIHTLYPTSTKNNLKLNTNSYARGYISFYYNTINAETVLKIPYKNNEDELVYEIEILFRDQRLEKVVKIIKYESGKIINEKEIETSKFKHSLDPIYLSSMQYKNFSMYESKFGKL